MYLYTEVELIISYDVLHDVQFMNKFIASFAFLIINESSKGFQLIYCLYLYMFNEVCINSID